MPRFRHVRHHHHADILLMSDAMCDAGARATRAAPPRGAAAIYAKCRYARRATLIRYDGARYEMRVDAMARYELTEMPLYEMPPLSPAMLMMTPRYTEARRLRMPPSSSPLR